MVEKPNFIDLCAGCGGLSLGLMEAGWSGRFAVEKNELAFETLKFNLLGKGKHSFDWPAWLPRTELSLESLLSTHEENLKKLKGKIELLAGGPPCQGFSTIGRRLAHDPRNKVFEHYLKLVKLIEPSMVLMENVRGILYPFKKNALPKEAEKAIKSPTYAEQIKAALEAEGYSVWHQIVHSKDHGVPQTRPRFILIGVRNKKGQESTTLKPFDLLKSITPKFLKDKHLGNEPVTVAEALSDLLTVEAKLESCKESPKFKQGAYGKQKSAYQRLMHGDMNGALADSHRFARHRPETISKFSWLLENCSKGKKLDQDERGEYANKKHTIYILKPDEPSPTLTTLPDDILHYEEPRILTVREIARLQSFPDWFQFKGKYTTGGKERVQECPRYTQVGNAVPPLVAEVIGLTLKTVLEKLRNA